MKVLTSLIVGFFIGGFTEVWLEIKYWNSAKKKIYEDYYNEGYTDHQKGLPNKVRKFP